MISDPERADTELLGYLVQIDKAILNRNQQNTIRVRFRSTVQVKECDGIVTGVVESADEVSVVRDDDASAHQGLGQAANRIVVRV